MIGGAMLACAVGAMLLIAWWSLEHDDGPERATGLLALRSRSKRTVARQDEKGGRRNRRPVKADASGTGPERVKANGKRDRRPDPATRRRRR